MPPPEPPPILLQDDRFVVLNKPAGLAVHPGPRGGPSVEDWFPTLSRRRDGPWLAHRLDADTAGCLVVALRRAALHAAQAAFAGGTAEKTYWAVVQGGPAAESGRVDLPLVKRSSPAGWHMVPDASGPPCVTDWQVRGRGAGLAWLELHPRTGRTHQIRVHCASLGCPVLGDPVYGSAAATNPLPLAGEGRAELPKVPRAKARGMEVEGRVAGPPGEQPLSGRATPPSPRPSPASGRGRNGDGAMLHLLARAIALPLDPPLHATAPPPQHMLAALRACGLDPNTTAASASSPSPSGRGSG